MAHARTTSPLESPASSSSKIGRATSLKPDAWLLAVDLYICQAEPIGKAPALALLVGGGCLAVFVTR
jgi:hypothetical protein